MKKRLKKIKRTGWLALMLVSFCACSQPQKKKKAEKNETASAQTATLPGYDLEHPETFRMQTVLNEISGISIRPAHGDTIFAIQDEDGYLFRFVLGNKNVTETKFGKKGDYEDVQLLGPDAIVLRSDGRLYRFPMDNPDPKKAAVVDEQKDLLPAGEYEGLYADEKENRIYVLCKHCAEKTSKSNTVFAFDLSPQGQWKASGQFTIDIKTIESMTAEKKIDFHPSALTRNASGGWLVLSSVNKMLVLTDDNWNVKSVVPLSPEIFNQPEGIAFDKAGTLYISNEKGSSSAATVLKFVRKP